MTLVDLIHQVQKWLPVRFGGTGNPHGWATDSVIGAYVNGTGVTIARGTVVELANYVTVGGGYINDSRIKPTTSVDQLNALGVVVGRFRTDDPVNEWEDADAEDGDVAAVCIFGKALTLVESEVTLGEYAYTAATDGYAYSDTYLRQGGIGMWESTGSTRQWLRLFGTSTTPGVMGQLVILIGDDVVAIQPGTRVDWRVPFNLRLLDWTILSTYTGSIQFDVRLDTYANFPPTGADSIIEADPPILSSGVKAEGTIPHGTDPLFGETGWAWDLDEDETVRFIAVSASGVKQVTLMFRYVRR
jgi:hypothetical protein